MKIAIVERRKTSAGAEVVAREIAAALPEAHIEKFSTAVAAIKSKIDFDLIIADGVSAGTLRRSSLLKDKFDGDGSECLAVDAGGTLLIYDVLTGKAEEKPSIHALGESMPLYASFDDIDDNFERADKELRIMGRSDGSELFAVRSGQDLVLARRAFNAPDGAFAVAQTGSERLISQIFFDADGATVGDRTYTYEECEDLPVIVYGTVDKIYRGVFA